MTRHLSRRNFLRTASLGATGAFIAARAPQDAFAQEVMIERAKNPRFLIVLSSFGGANQVDAFLSRRESEVPNAKTLNAYPDDMVQTIGEFRAIDMKGPSIGAIPAAFTANQSNFVRKHNNDMMVVTHTGTSVNHFVAQQRSINGNAAWKGRTLQEAVALTYGAGYAIPNVHLVNGTGFTERGHRQHAACLRLWRASAHAKPLAAFAGRLQGDCRRARPQALRGGPQIPQ